MSPSPYVYFSPCVVMTSTQMGEGVRCCSGAGWDTTDGLTTNVFLKKRPDRRIEGIRFFSIQDLIPFYGKENHELFSLTMVCGTEIHKPTLPHQGLWRLSR